MTEIFQKFFSFFVAFMVSTQRAVILKTAREGAGLHCAAVMKARQWNEANLFPAHGLLTQITGSLSVYIGYLCV